MADVKLQALRTFSGNEGLIRRGDVFTVDSQERADQLLKLDLVQEAESDAEVTNYSQRNEELNDMTKDDLVKVADDEGVSYSDGATKADIKNAIVRERENQYLIDQAKLTAGTRSGAVDATGSPTGNVAAETESGDDGSGGQ
jgi:hypothetical protein